jgi:hypothetical protein
MVAEPAEPAREFRDGSGRNQSRGLPACLARDEPQQTTTGPPDDLEPGPAATVHGL